MKPEIKKIWVDALESGEYEQGTGQLCKIDLITNKRYYCCLGVLCDLAAKEGVVGEKIQEHTGNVAFGIEEAFLPPPVIEWAGVDSSVPRVAIEELPAGASLTALNDGFDVYDPEPGVIGEKRLKLDFKQIAALIKEQL